MIKVPAFGPENARIMLVGEAPGHEEETYMIKDPATGIPIRKPQPFVGSSGRFLNQLLGNAGIVRSDCYITNVCKYRPPNNNIKAWFETKTAAKKRGREVFYGRYPNKLIVEGVYELEEEIECIKPELIIALGDTALWALTGESGIVKWRGSIMKTHGTTVYKVIPTFHPAAIMRNYSWKVFAEHDLKKCSEELDNPVQKPDYNFIIRPSFKEVKHTLFTLLNQLNFIELRISVDLETRAGHIACIGLAWSSTDAICIPFMCTESNNGYWHDPDVEYAVIHAIRGIIGHSNARIVGQNYLYDEQYNILWWGAKSTVYMDTMLAQHVCYPGMAKDLNTLSSLHCKYHEYWKDEGKLWDTSMPEDDYWVYNCKDAVTTLEISYALDKQIEHLDLREQFDFQMRTYQCCLQAMLRGVRVNKKDRARIGLELNFAAEQYECWFKPLIGADVHELPKSKTAKPWYRSPIQQAKLFYDELGQKEVMNRKTWKRTVDDDALKKIGTREPLLQPLTDALSNYRSIGVVYSNCIESKLDSDQRVRCSYNVGGTVTFRLSSSQNAFGSGMNLQNLTSGEKASENISGLAFSIPNIRKLLIPDTGYIIYAHDLDRADLYVVVWEAGDDELKQILKEGVNPHVENAKTIFGGNPQPSKLASSPYHKAKQGVHATNYGVRKETLAAELGITIHDADRFINRWFAAHPRIKEWHNRVERSLQRTKSVSNKLGFRIRFFDRIDNLLPDALAWIPQSTVALVINTGWHNIDANLPWAQVLMQVHDELVLQVPKAMHSKRKEIREQMLITIPYEDPLTIPIGVSMSDKSWGECEDIEWE
jgi:DNA polymerase I-like protein with 3'-5' exonuclease and polymerase domains/uracil-DNA glycosylase